MNVKLDLASISSFEILLLSRNVSNAAEYLI